MEELFHIPVMLSRVLSFLNVVQGGLYIDSTLGGGGHTEAILEKGGKVIGIDRDPEAVAYARDRLTKYRGRCEMHIALFSHIAEIAGTHAGSVDGVIMDLGISSRMIDTSSRGFSYKRDGPLLMNMGYSEKTAFDVVNTKSASELAGIFKEYGEEYHQKQGQ